jgi:hypothetical protein
MPLLARSWPALFAWGAGLLHVALAAEVARAHLAPGVLLVVALAVQGVGELAWGTVSLRRGRPVASRTAMAGGLTGVVVAGAAIGAGGSPIAAVAALVLLVPAAVLAGRASRSVATPTSTWGPVVGLLVGAGIVAGLVTPALSTTDGVQVHGHFVFVDPHAGH